MSDERPTGAPPRPTDTPDDVVLTWEAPPPVTDPTLGTTVPPSRERPPARHRLVTLGDSLTHGFQSGAISLTSSSWPAMVARELGSEFRYPTYEGYGGLPLNIETCLRHLEAEFGAVDIWDSVPATIWLLHYAHSGRAVVGGRGRTGLGAAAGPQPQPCRLQLRHRQQLAADPRLRRKPLV